MANAVKSTRVEVRVFKTHQVLQGGPISNRGVILERNSVAVVTAEG